MVFEQDMQNLFVVDMMEKLPTASEIFNRLLLHDLEKFFDIRNAFITCFDDEGHFLSLTDPRKIYLGDEHPYASFAGKDICAQTINRECSRDGMWHDNVTPYIYRSTDLLANNDYETSEYVQFISHMIGAKYLLIMPFGINGCIHLCIYRGADENDFSDMEMSNMEKVYGYIAKTYKSFKALEKPKIVSLIKDEVILAKDDAYLITDINHKILTCNSKAAEYLSAIMGRDFSKIELREIEALLIFLLQGIKNTDATKTTVINGYVLEAHPFSMFYIHGIVEMYHWIAITKEIKPSAVFVAPTFGVLTKREEKVAALLCQGLSYQAIADELCISFHTVKNHIQNIFGKYEVNSRYQFLQVFGGKSGKGK